MLQDITVGNELQRKVGSSIQSMVSDSDSDSDYRKQRVLNNTDRLCSLKVIADWFGTLIRCHDNYIQSLSSGVPIANGSWDKVNIIRIA